MPFPALIPKPVVVPTVSREIDGEPAGIFTVLTVNADISESPKITPYMIEYAIQNNLDATLVTPRDEFS